MTTEDPDPTAWVSLGILLLALVVGLGILAIAVKSAS